MVAFVVRRAEATPYDILRSLPAAQRRAGERLEPDRQRRKWKRPAFQQRGARDVHDHRERGVVADDADDVDHALLAELRDGPRVGRFVDALIGP